MGTIETILAILLFSALAYGGLVNWLDLPQTFAVFFLVTFLGVIFVFGIKEVINEIDNLEEKLEDINNRLVDLEDFLKKKK